MTDPKYVPIRPGARVVVAANKYGERLDGEWYYAGTAGRDEAWIRPVGAHPYAPSKCVNRSRLTEVLVDEPEEQ